MEMLSNNWIGAVISLPAAAAVIYVVMKFLGFMKDERKSVEESRALERSTYKETLDTVVARQEKSTEAHAAGLKENTDQLNIMTVTLSTALAESRANCQESQRKMDSAAAEFRRRKSDAVSVEG